MKKTRKLLHIWNKPPNFASQIPGGGVFASQNKR